MSHAGEFWMHWGLSGFLDINGFGAPIAITNYPAPGEPEGCLGYHWVDANYRPYAVVFAGLCRDLGKSTTAVISHEMLEMLADQSTSMVNLFSLGDGTWAIVPVEVCDPCQEPPYEGPTGTHLSNFVFPAWFVPASQRQVDFLGLLPGPLRDASGAPAQLQTVMIAGPAPSDDDAAYVIDAASTAQRNEVAAAACSRAAVAEQLRARSTGGRRPYPPPGPPTGRQGPAGLERRKQPTRPGTTITVVRRENIPVFVEQLPS